MPSFSSHIAYGPLTPGGIWNHVVGSWGFRVWFSLGCGDVSLCFVAFVVIVAYVVLWGAWGDWSSFLRILHHAQDELVRNRPRR